MERPLNADNHSEYAVFIILMIIIIWCIILILNSGKFRLKNDDWIVTKEKADSWIKKEIRGKWRRQTIECQI